MTSRLSITYCASRDPLGLVSEEEYERYKNQLLEAIQSEWPDATVAIEDDEEAHADLKGISGQAEQDVRDRLEDIVREVIDSGAWQEEKDDFYDEEEDLGDEEEKDEY